MSPIVELASPGVADGLGSVVSGGLNTDNDTGVVVTISTLGKTFNELEGNRVLVEELSVVDVVAAVLEIDFRSLEDETSVLFISPDMAGGAFVMLEAASEVCLEELEVSVPRTLEGVAFGVTSLYVGDELTMLLEAAAGFCFEELVVNVFIGEGIVLITPNIANVFEPPQASLESLTQG